MKTQNNIKVLLENKDLRENALFILDPGCDTDIRNCAQVGASVLIPNLTMSAHLMAVTVIRESKRLIATTLEMWESLQIALAQYPQLAEQLEVVLFRGCKAEAEERVYSCA